MGFGAPATNYICFRLFRSFFSPLTLSQRKVAERKEDPPESRLEPSSSTVQSRCMDGPSQMKGVDDDDDDDLMLNVLGCHEIY